MKRLFTLLTFVLLTMSAIAQQRMNFLGQPLGCSLTTFKQRMAYKGYEYIGENEINTHFFKGVFGGENVEIAALVTPKSKIVCDVLVDFLDYRDSSKESLEYKKESLIQSFIKKYGNYSYENGTGTYWWFSYGAIGISLDYENIQRLAILYMDKLGDEMCEREKESDY